MSSTTFSGPVNSTAGFVGNLNGTLVKLTATTLATLPAATAGNAGTVYFVSGTSTGNALVFSSGVANINVVTGVAVVA
jgi:hypothetical protein